MKKVNRNSYLFSIVLYRDPEVEKFDIAIGIIAGSDEAEEWIYYPFSKGIELIEDSLGDCVDIQQFWERYIVDEIFSESDLIDKYVELLDTEGKYRLYEPLVRKGVNVQWVVRSIEVTMEADNYLMVNGDQRFDNLLKKEAPHL